MKFLLNGLFLLLSLITHVCHAQQVHSATVNINQPATCIVAGLGNHDVNVNVYPNPATHALEITSEKSINELTIIDSTGKTIYSRKGKIHSVNVDTSKFQRGIYHCILKYDSTITRRKIIIK